jgi:hypothetical protein
VYWGRPLSRLEAALYIALAAVLAAVLLDRLLEHFEMAERAAVEATLNRVNSGLNTRLAYEWLAGRVADESAWARRNPFELANARPSNFAGEADRPDPAAVPRGQWLYDRTDGILLYRPRLARRLETGDGSGVLRFRLGAKDLPTAGLRRVYQLVPAVDYRWENF